MDLGCAIHYKSDAGQAIEAIITQLVSQAGVKLEDEVFKALIQKFNFKVIGPCKWFLGMQISPLYESTMVNQEAFLKAALD